MENFETAMETQQRRMTLKIDFFILLLPLIFDLAKGISRSSRCDGWY